MMEQAKQVQMADAVSKIEKTQSETAENYAQIEALGVKTQIDAMNVGVGMAA
jgi:putative Mn2+ efflux pump MntP